MRSLKALLAASTLLTAPLAAAALAQAPEGQVYVQIEARSTLAAAEDRLRYWSGQLPNVSGFALSSGWYGVMIGPYGAAEAESMLRQMRARGEIPGDSFLPDPKILRQQVWPSATSTVPARPEPIDVGAAPEVAVTTPLQVPTFTAPPAPELTAQEDDRALTRDDRIAIQRALHWTGHYSASIDGAFGRGTRSAISAWQADQGVEQTGFLTPRDRQSLIDTWRAETEALGLKTVLDGEAGIEMALPMGLVEFDRYEPPFALYRAKGESGVTLRLISQAGGPDELAALYQQLQRATAPLGDLTDSGFALTDTRDGIKTRASVQLREGRLRGYAITAPITSPAAGDRLWAMMGKSFFPQGNRVLDPTIVPIEPQVQAALQSGLEAKSPARAASGVYIGAEGRVLTAASAVANCQRVTLDGGVSAEIMASDTRLGYALLRPQQALAPHGVAPLSDRLPSEGAQTVAAGFSLGAGMPVPTMTFGKMGPKVGDHLASVQMNTLAGDIGAPVMGPDGSVVGLLQAADHDPTRQLGAGAQYLTPLTAIAADLAAKGQSLTLGTPVSGEMAPEDLTVIGTAMAVQVLCWN